MSEFYPIVTVEPEWVLGGEDMGSKEKFWYYETGEGKKNCLFKYSRQHTGEHWAEKIAAEVAACLDILHARVELAEFLGGRGSSTESFAGGLRVLAHGNQLLGRAVSSYDPGVQFRQSAHTYPDLFRPALAKLNKLDEGSLRNVIDHVPSDWMSPSARKFALALMHYNIEQLRTLDP